MPKVLRAEADRPTYRFWLLAAFVTLVFLLGGSSRADVASLLILRPVAAFVLVAGLYSLTREHLQKYRFTFAIMIAACALIILHLIPLPPGLWHLFPGRGLTIEIDQAMGTPNVWRPLSMVPVGTWNALFAMLPPLAALVLGAQLHESEHRRIVPLLMAIAMFSGFLGLLQVIGQGIGNFYAAAGDGPEMARGLFANQNHHAAFLACAIPVFAVFAGTDVKHAEAARTRMIAAIIGIFLLVLLIAITGSRSGMVMVFVALASLVLVYRKPVSALPTRRRAASRFDPRFIMGTGLTAASMVVVFLFYKAGAATRLFGNDPMGDFRFQIWQPIAKMVGTYMPIGSGIGSFVEVYQIGEPLNLLRAEYVNHAHNDLLELAMTGGIPTLVLLALVVGGWGWRTYAVMVQQPDSANGQRQCIRLDRLGAVVIALLALASLTDYPLRTPSLSCLLVMAALWMRMTTAASIKNQSSAGK